jgi:hypothetical protein
LELTAEAGKFAHAIKMLSSIESERAELFQHLTFRNEVELTRNFEKVVKLISRFAKEMKIHDDEVDNRNSESA